MSRSAAEQGGLRGVSNLLRPPQKGQRWCRHCGRPSPSVGLVMCCPECQLREIGLGLIFISETMEQVVETLEQISEPMKQAAIAAEALGNHLSQPVPSSSSPDCPTPQEATDEPDQPGKLPSRYRPATGNTGPPTRRGISRESKFPISQHAWPAKWQPTPGVRQ